MKEEQKILINRINELCKKEGLSYYTLSYRSGVPLSTLMHLMDGTVKNPGIYTIVRICGGLRISLTEFFDTDEFRTLVISMNLEG